MSWRGSFVTEYIYCERCLQIAKEVLLGKDKYLHSLQLSSWNKNEDNLPIIAGKVGDIAVDGELDTFEYELIPKLEERICHKVRVAVLGETGERIFTAKPKYAGVRNS